MGLSPLKIALSMRGVPIRECIPIFYFSTESCTPIKNSGDVQTKINVVFVVVKRTGEKLLK